MDDWFLVSGYVAIGINNQSGHACRHYPRRCSHKSICSRFHMVPRRRHTPQLVAAHLVLQAPDIVPCIWTQFHPSNSLTMDQSTRLAAATLRLVSSARIFTTEHRADPSSRQVCEARSSLSQLKMSFITEMCFEQLLSKAPMDLSSAPERWMSMENRIKADRSLHSPGPDLDSSRKETTYVFPTSLSRDSR